MNPVRTRFPRPARLAGAVLACCGALLGACSDDDELATVPPGSTLSISPEENNWEIFDRRDEEGRCSIDPSQYVDLPILISLRNSGGVPIGDAEVSVYVNLADNTYSGFPVLQLYDDRNSNGVIDGDGELVSDGADRIARVSLSRYGGERLMLLRANLSCPWRSGVFAYVEGVSALASVQVTIQEEE